jgi:Protein of unknown function (DUF3592)
MRLKRPPFDVREIVQVVNFAMFAVLPGDGGMFMIGVGAASRRGIGAQVRNAMRAPGHAAALSLPVLAALTEATWAAAATRPARPDVVPTLLVLALIGSGVCGLIALWCFFTGGRKADRAGPRRSWGVAPGRIIESRVERRSPVHGKSYEEPVVHYSFVVGGRQFFGNVVDIDATPARASSAAKRIVARYRPGTKVNVRYNPDNLGETELVGASSAGRWRRPLGLLMSWIGAVWFLFFLVALMLRTGGFI